MPLINILKKVAADHGAANYDTDTTVRAFLLSKINEAAQEIWEANDLPGALREVYVKVTPNYITALPSFIYALRAIRKPDLEEPWRIVDLRPRYHYNPWKDMWKNWRIIGHSAIQLEITNIAPIIYKVPVANSSLTVTTVGSTPYSRRISETITMSATSNSGLQNFTAIESIQCNETSTYDITIEDADGNELAIIYNDEEESRYTIVDISQYPNLTECSDGTFIMEVLYKMLLKPFINDNDVFPVPGYDVIIADKTIQLLTEKQEGKIELALAMHQKIDWRIKKRMQDVEGAAEKTVKFAPNKTYGIFKNTGYYTRGRRTLTRF